MRQLKVIKDAVGKLHTTLSRAASVGLGKQALEQFRTSYATKISELEAYLKKPGTEDHLNATD